MELKKRIDRFDVPLYHIIRTPNGEKGDIVINNFKRVIGEDIEHIKYDSDSDVKDINKVLERRPQQHTYIFIKEKLRCAKTLYKKHLGVLYERYTKIPDDAVINQGLIGRGTGYDDNGKSVYFTNIPSIKKYKQLWNSDFTDKSVKWKSKTTRIKSNKLQSKGTYNNPALINGMNVSSDEDKRNDCRYRIFDSLGGAEKFRKDEFSMRPTGKDGSTKAFMTKTSSDDWRYCNLDEMMKKITRGLSKSSVNGKVKSRIMPVYVEGTLKQIVWWSHKSYPTIDGQRLSDTETESSSGDEGPLSGAGGPSADDGGAAGGGGADRSHPDFEEH